MRKRIKIRCFFCRQVYEGLDEKESVCPYCGFDNVDYDKTVVFLCDKLEKCLYSITCRKIIIEDYPGNGETIWNKGRGERLYNVDKFPEGFEEKGKRIDYAPPLDEGDIVILVGYDKDPLVIRIL